MASPPGQDHRHMTPVRVSGPAFYVFREGNNPLGRRKLPAHLTAAVREYLRARVPLGTDAGAIMTEICLHARSPQIPDDRVGEVMQQMALSRLEIAYQAWRQGVDAGTAVGFLTEKVLAELRPQQRLRLEG